MTRRDIIAKYPDLLRKEFQRELSGLLQISEELMDSLSHLLQRIRRYEELFDDEVLARFSQEQKISIDDLMVMLQPLRYLAFITNRERLAPSDLLEELAQMGFLDSRPENGIKRVANLIALSLPFFERIEEELIPRLPAARLKSMISKANMVTEFEEEFEVGKDTPSSYKPAIKKIHVYTALRLSFRDDELEPVTIALTHSELQQVIDWLHLAQVQARATQQAIGSAGQKAD